MNECYRWWSDHTGGSLTFISELQADVSAQANVVPPAATGAKRRKWVCWVKIDRIISGTRSEAAASVALEFGSHHWSPA